MQHLVNSSYTDKATILKMSASAPDGPALVSDLLRRPALDVTELIRRYALAARVISGSHGVRVRVDGPGDDERLAWSVGRTGGFEQPRWKFPLVVAGAPVGSLELFHGDGGPAEHEAEAGVEAGYEDCAALAQALARELDRLGVRRRKEITCGCCWKPSTATSG